MNVLRNITSKTHSVVEVVTAPVAAKVVKVSAFRRAKKEMRNTMAQEGIALLAADRIRTEARKAHEARLAEIAKAQKEAAKEAAKAAEAAAAEATAQATAQATADLIAKYSTGTVVLSTKGAARVSARAQRATKTLEKAAAKMEALRVAKLAQIEEDKATVARIEADPSFNEGVLKAMFDKATTTPTYEEYLAAVAQHQS